MRKLRIISFIVLFLLFFFYCKKNKEPIITITTSDISIETKTTAIGGGNISDDGGIPVIDRGICWSTSKNPTIELQTKTSDGTGIGEFTSHIAGLSIKTQYYVRAFATNSKRTVYSEQVSFYIYYGDQTGTVKDADGNVYNIITIGTQKWMKEDLRTSRYNDGTLIPLVTDNTTWSNLTTPGYQSSYYNWYTVNTGKLCPTGWHVPSESEWKTLIDFVGDKAGRSLKATDGWRLNGGNNETNFTAYGRDYRAPDGSYPLIKYMTGLWWGANDCSTNATSLKIDYMSDYAYIGCSSTKKSGLGVRCLQDYK
jgi:uncharacterized protein (TIGR02145 family)